MLFNEMDMFSRMLDCIDLHTSKRVFCSCKK